MAASPDYKEPEFTAFWLSVAAVSELKLHCQAIGHAPEEFSARHHSRSTQPFWDWLGWLYKGAEDPGVSPYPSAQYSSITDWGCWKG